MDIVICVDHRFVMPTGVIKYNLMTVFLYKNPKWRNTKFEQEISESLQEPIIIHFAGGDKPWFKYNENEPPLSTLFCKYQNVP